MTLKIAMRIDVDADEAEKRVRDFKASIADIGKAAPAGGAAAAIDHIGDAAQAAAADTAKLTTAEQAAGAAASAMARQATTAANDAATLGQRSGAAGRDVAELAAAARTMSAAAAAMAAQAASGAAGVRQLGAAAQQATGEVAGLERQAANSNGAVSVLTGSLGGLRGMLAALGIGITVQQLTQMADGWTIVGNRLRLVAANENDVSRLRLAVFGLAQDTRSALGSTAELFSGISRAAATLKVSEGSILAVTRTINQGFRVSGGSQASADAAVMQLMQGLSSGVLRGEEFNSVMEQAPRLAQALADALGKTRGELRALAEQGQLTAETVVKALLSQAEAIDAEYQRMQATIGEGWTVLLNGAERWVGQAATATGAAALLANTLVGLGDNFGVVGAAIAALATVGLIRLVAGLRTAAAATLEKRVAQAAEAQAEVAATAAALRKAEADLVAAQAELRRLSAIGATGRALVAEAAAQNAATAATERHTAALVANATAQARVGAAGVARSALGGAVGLLGGVPGIVATAAIAGVTLLAGAQDVGERSAQSYSRAMELAARSINFVPQAAEAASGAVKQLGSDMLASTQAAARRSAEDATAAIDTIQGKISGAAGRATVSAGGSLLDRLFGNDAGVEFTRLADQVERSGPRTASELDGIIDRLNAMRGQAQALGAGGVVTRIDTFTKVLLDQRNALAEEESRLGNANRVLAETERRQQAAAREAQGFTQALREQRDLMNRATGNNPAVALGIAAASAPLTTGARGAADSLDTGGLAGLSRFRAEQQLAAQATKDAEKVFKDYQAAQGVTGEKALSVAEGLKSQNAELRLAAQAAQEAGRATAELNAETERRERLAKLDQDNRDLQAALMAWRALPNGVRDYAKAVEEATISSRAAAMARDLGRGDDPATINAIVASLRQRLDLERQIKEEQDKQALAARVRDAATGGLASYNRELELSAQLLAEGRINQAQFSAEADRISVQGFEAYRKAVKDGNTELANAVKAQIEAQAKIAWGALQAKAALNDVISRALDAMISLTTAGSQAGGILGWVAGMANSVLTNARQAQGQTETVPNWNDYWKGVQGDWASWNKGHGGSRSSRTKETEFDKESKRLKDQIRDMQIQADALGLSSEAASRLTAQRRLLSAAEKDGRKETADLTAEINKQADAYAKASEAQRQAQIEQRRRETFAGNTVSLIGSTARPAEARSRELADLSRMAQLIQVGDPTMLDQLAESGYSVADALQAIQRRALELNNPGLSGFLDGFKTSFRDLATSVIEGTATIGDAWNSFLGQLQSHALDKFLFEPAGEAIDGWFDRLMLGTANDNAGAGPAARGGTGGIGGVLSGLLGGPADSDTAAISVGTATINVANGAGGSLAGLGSALLPDRSDATIDRLAGSLAGDKLPGGAGTDLLGNAVDQVGSALTEVADGVRDEGSGFLSGFGGALGSIVNGFGSLLSGDVGSGIGGILNGLLSIIPGFGNGAAFVRGAVHPFAAGTVVTGPTYFPMAGGKTGLMGEAGPEAIMPLITGARGLAVRATNENGQVVPAHLTRLSDGALGVALPPVVPHARGGVFGGVEMPAPPPTGAMPWRDAAPAGSSQAPSRRAGRELPSMQFHFHGVSDFDSFRRSRGQLAAQFGGEIQRQLRRNG